MQKKEDTCRRKNIFIMMLGLFSLALFIKSYGQGMSVTNTTLLALNYKNGFLPDAFLGTVYQLLDQLFGGRMMNYPMAMRFSEIITVVQYVILFAFFNVCLKKACPRQLDNTGMLLVFYGIFAVSFYCGYDFFGSPEACLMTVTLIYGLFMIQGKWTPLLYAIPIVGILLETEYLLSYFGIFEILLFYESQKEMEERKRRQWKTRMIVSGLIVLAGFICFGAFPLAGENAWEQTVGTAQALSVDGTYNEDLLRRVMQGIFESKSMFPQGGNILELLFFLILFSPYLLLAVGLFRKIIKTAEERNQKTVYVAILAGSALIVPLFLLHCHYGKWVFAALSYYAIVFLVLLAKRDDVLESAVYSWMKALQEKHAWLKILLIYPIMFVPFSDLNICAVTRMFAEDVKFILQIAGFMQ